ncbi:MAG: hypothetical protein ACI8RC_002880, partial [Ilumatobacter sp.]
DGNIDLRSAFEDVDRSGGDFRAANEACRNLLADNNFGGGRQGGVADDTAVADALVELADCVRDQGFPEATEVSFGQPGQGDSENAGGQQGADGGAPQRGQGEGGGPGQGDIGMRLAGAMGLDAEDPAVIAAMQACTPIIEQAFTDTGVGGRGQDEG